MELLRYKVAHQRLTGGKTKLISGYIDYVEAEFDFSPDWTGLDKWAHFTKGDVTYDVNLIDDRIEKEQHLNLSEGTWEVKVHGDKNENGEVVMRITTDTAYVTVESYGEIHEGGVLPESVATAAEQIAAKAEEAVEKAEDALSLANEVKAKADAGDFNGKDGYTPRIEIEQTYDASTDRSGFTVKVFNEDGSFSVAGVKDGERGPQGIQGVQGLRGPAGIDGITYFYELEETESGVNITVTDAGGRVYATAFVKNGEDGKEGPAGADGAPGENGFSPTVEIQPIWSAEGPLLGRRIIITDINGPQVFSVLNGEDGKDYVLTEEDKKEIAGMIEGEGAEEVSIGETEPTDENIKIWIDPNDEEKLPLSAFENDMGYITEDDIPEIPTVPTKISAFENDKGYITADDIPEIPEAPQADWAQNDETAADYVKNRTHWVEEVEEVYAEEDIYTIDADGLYLLPGVPELIEDDTYIVNWNGAQYSCVAWLFEMDGVAQMCLGNPAFVEGEDNGMPFLATHQEGMTVFFPLDDPLESITLGIIHKYEKIEKIPDKFIGNRFEIVINDLDGFAFSNTTFDEIVAAFKEGKELYVRYLDGTTYDDGIVANWLYVFAVYYSITNPNTGEKHYLFSFRGTDLYGKTRFFILSNINGVNITNGTYPLEQGG